ncbi:MAG: DNA-directed RNA polymerase subunit alpha [Saprospiraceae bacterium]|jgi:DNA-directed RNA polymerase subunit alpha
MLQLQFDKLESSSTDLGEQTTRFVLNELVPGRGLTIGNALRRVLLSELEGTAITSVKVQGINSEFSIIPGVREDVLELMLNLKQIKFRGFLETPFFTRLIISGPSIVSASNITLPPELQILDSSQYIANVSKNTTFELELKIESGSGYNCVDEKLMDSSLDFLHIDSIFTPIKTVNFDIKDSYQIGEKRTEALNLAITTNGSTSPSEALNKAALILQNLFSSLIIEESDVTFPPEKDTTLDISIEELELSVRSYNCLKAANIQTLEELIDYSVKDLKKIKNLGKKSVTEVVEKLHDRFGIRLN